MTNKSKKIKSGNRRTMHQGATAAAITATPLDTDPLAALAHVPPGALVIVRDYDHPDRAQIAARVTAAARQRGWLVAIAGDPTLARAVGAGGVHLPRHQLFSMPPPSVRLVSAACHDAAALARAAALGVAHALVSPVFPTSSHPGEPALGVHRLARLIAAFAGRGDMRLLALGGVSKTTLARLRGVRGLNGFAAISGWRDGDISRYWQD